MMSLSGFLFEDNYDSQSAGFEEFCRIASDSEYGGIELRMTQIKASDPVAKKRRIRRIASEYGLSVTCYTARGFPVGDRQELEKVYADCLELCGYLDCGLMKASGLFAGNLMSASEASEIADQFGVKLCVNNHTGSSLETVDDVLAFFSDPENSGMGLLFDSMHFHAAGEDCLAGVDALFPYIANILVQSLKRQGKPEAENEVDHAGVIRKMFRKGYGAARGGGLITVVENGYPVAERTGIAEKHARQITEIISEIPE